MSTLPALRVLSVIPPMTQLNTPYPSTAYLTGFLRSRGVHGGAGRPGPGPGAAPAVARTACWQMHARRLKACNGRAAVRHRWQHFLAEFDRATTPASAAVIRFLQGRRRHAGAPHQHPPAACRKARAFASLDVYIDEDGGDPLAWAFGALGLQDRARHLATLYLNDLADVLRDAVDSRFEFVRYAEQLATSQPSFEPLAQALAAPPNLVDRTLDEPDPRDARPPPARNCCCCRCRFPARCMRRCASRRPSRPWRPTICPIALGGGFVNTELRELSRAAPVRLRRLRDARRGRAAAAGAARAPARPAFARALGALFRARGRTRPCALPELARAGRALRRGGHAHLGRPAAEAATCRCWTCSTR